MTADHTPRAAPASAMSIAGYRAHFATYVVAMMADNIEHVISYWMAFQKFHSPALAGFAVISHWVPFLLFSVWAGALADRHDPRRIIQCGMLMFMACSLGWGWFFATHSLQLYDAVLLLTLHGFAGVLWQTASQLLLHDIVAREQLPSAVRLNATARYVGLLVGPGVGSLILLVLGPIYGIFLNALFYLPLLLWLWKAPYGPRFRRDAPAPPRPVRGLADILKTCRDIAGNRLIVVMTALAGLASGLIGNSYQAQMPGVAHDLGHGDPGLTYSMLLAADACGAMVAGVLLETLRRLHPNPRTALVLALVWGAAIAAFALTRSYALALTMLFTAGLFELTFSSMAQTLVQMHAPAAIRGRVIGLFNMSALGLRAFAGVTVGLGGSLVGIHASLAASAAVLLVAVGALLLWFTQPAARVPAQG